MNNIEDLIQKALELQSYGLVTGMGELANDAVGNPKASPFAQRPAQRLEDGLERPESGPPGMSASGIVDNSIDMNYRPDLHPKTRA